MEAFKQFYNIEESITLQAKIEDDNLKVLYKDEWVQLNYLNNPKKVL